MPFVRLACIRAQPSDLRVRMDRPVRLREELTVDGQNQGVLGSGQRDVKQPLHFLTVCQFQLVFEFIRVRLIENDLRLRPRPAWIRLG